jgi:hypothetical protein
MNIIRVILRIYTKHLYHNTKDSRFIIINFIFPPLYLMISRLHNDYVNYFYMWPFSNYVAQFCINEIDMSPP